MNTRPAFDVTPLDAAADPDWLQMRLRLWPDATASEHLAEMAAQVAAPRQYVQFVARGAQGQAVGFVEASIRTDYVNGTETSPVAFLEGLFVQPRARRQGVARHLVRAVEQWAAGRGCRELASDASVRNRSSHAVHRQLGFAETERVVYFNKRLK